MEPQNSLEVIEIIGLCSGNNSDTNDSNDKWNVSSAIKISEEAESNQNTLSLDMATTKARWVNYFLVVLVGVLLCYMEFFGAGIGAVLLGCYWFWKYQSGKRVFSGLLLGALFGSLWFFLAFFGMLLAPLFIVGGSLVPEQAVFWMPKDKQTGGTARKFYGILFLVCIAITVLGVHYGYLETKPTDKVSETSKPSTVVTTVPEKEQLSQEELEKKRLAKQKIQQEWDEQVKANRENKVREEQERSERALVEAAQVRIANEKLEQEKLGKEQQEKKRLDQERLEAERQGQSRIAKKKLEQLNRLSIGVSYALVMSAFPSDAFKFESMEETTDSDGKREIRGSTAGGISLQVAGPAEAVERVIYAGPTDNSILALETFSGAMSLLDTLEPTWKGRGEWFRNGLNKVQKGKNVEVVKGSRRYAIAYLAGTLFMTVRNKNAQPHR